MEQITDRRWSTTTTWERRSKSLAIGKQHYQTWHASLFGLFGGADGFIALVSALKQNTSLLYLDLQNNYGFQ
jgi:hypothetical protein